ncbi:MAG TPA: HAMP domain-containing sensor histidine kinase [Candidatus Angelobacter sp.]|jgi:signal transduction histidine kinase
MLDFIHSRLIAIQYSAVILLVIISFQAVRALQKKEFRLIAFAWLANLCYLLATEVGPYLIHPHTKSLGKNLSIIADIFDFFANSIFWYVAHQYGRESHCIYFSRLNRAKFLLMMAVFYGSYLILNYSIPHDRYISFFLFSLPQILFDILALTALAYYFDEIVASVHDARPSHLLFRTTLAYACIQPLQLLEHDFVKSHLGKLDPADFGFGAGLVAKGAIVLGIITLFVKSAEAATTIIAEQKRIQALTKAIDRLAHELGTPISETLTHAIALKTLPPANVSSRLKKLEGAASRAAAMLGASKFNMNPATSTLAFRQADGTWRDEALSKVQTMNLNTLMEIAENAVRDTRSEKIKYHHQYSGNCCLECIPSEVIQVFINIFRNAYDACPGKTGRIDVTTVNESSATDEKSKWPKGKVKAIVRDNGEGINDDAKSKMFIEGYSTRKGNGRGYGLTIIKKLVEKHHGLVEILSPPVNILSRDSQNKGTEVVVVFPRVPCSPR